MTSPLAQRLAQVKWGEFKLGELFEKCPVGLKENFDKQRDISTERNQEFNLPLVNAKHGNNGVMYYGRENEWDSVSMAIDIVNDGAISTGDVYPQPQKTGVLYNAYLIKAKSNRVNNSKLLMFLSTVIGKAIKHLYGYEKKASWERVKNNSILLPILTNGDINFVFMENCVAELEAERVAELEAERVAELEAYLTASGLKDYTLTKEEQNALKQFDSINWGKFTINDCAEVLPSSAKLTKENLTDSGCVDVYSSNSTNNGVVGQTNLEPNYLVTKETPFYLIFGDHTRAMNIAHRNFSVMDNVKVLIPKYQEKNIILFISTAWKKAIPNLGYARHWSKAKDCEFYLPTTQNNEIDFEVLKVFISAMKKLTIKDILEDIDRQISATKKVISEA